MINLITLAVVFAMLAAALFCIFEGMALYRECPTDEIYLVPLGTSVALTVIAAALLVLV